jgi:hypothetical protein
MEGRMFRFRARVASLFAVRLNRVKRFAPRGWLRKGQRLKAEVRVKPRHAALRCVPVVKKLCVLREKQKSRPDCPERL